MANDVAREVSECGKVSKRVRECDTGKRRLLRFKVCTT